ncbi:MAG: 6-carboxytetrahydropterin synthase [Gammaproteobacteria bacterium]|jgi:6-pyruvoyltetrahydropterin/6-carboxytetrahydropterin synthase|nr:6-carboxytetrahydropterin synthase [Gammaproteobacteria bacterium]
MHEENEETEELTTIEISKEYLKFSAGHFTIFSAHERESLHGHDFALTCDVTAPLNQNGMAFDYRLLKDKLKALCDALDEQVLLPGESPYLEVRDQGEKLIAIFGDEEIAFLKRDVKVLPIRNATVEEFARLLLHTLLKDSEIKRWDLRRARIRISSGDGQWASSTWEKT